MHEIYNLLGIGYKWYTEDVYKQAKATILFLKLVASIISKMLFLKRKECLVYSFLYCRLFMCLNRLKQIL